MGMRHSDATFLTREVIPVLAAAAPIAPSAAEALERLQERLAEERYPSPGESASVIVKHSRSYSGDYDGEPPTSDGWRIYLEVDEHRVPFIEGHLFEGGDHDGRVSLVLDNRYLLDTDVEEVNRWAWWLANAMAISAGRTSHGPNSYVRNPHGRSGAGDPPEIVGELLVAEPLRWPDPDGLRVLRAALNELGVSHAVTTAPVANAVRLLRALIPAEVE